MENILKNLKFNPFCSETMHVLITIYFNSGFPNVCHLVDFKLLRIGFLIHAFFLVNIEFFRRRNMLRDCTSQNSTGNVFVTKVIGNLRIFLKREC